MTNPVHEMPDHVIDIDETTDGPDTAFKAFCDCGWDAPHWSHSDSMCSFIPNDPTGTDAARDEAYAQARAEGDAHLADAAG